MGSVIFENVTKAYEKNLVIQPTTFEVKDKEFVVLVGPSGCGKSTMLRMIAGLEEVTSGSIKIDEKEVNNLPPKDRDIAIVFQNYALYPHMTAYENMAFGLKIRRLPKDEIKKKVMEAAAILEIEDLLDRKPKAMSGGQRQRVAIGRALVRNPKVFLFDEPLSNLDAQLRGHMRVEIAALHKRLQTTMIYVTHDQVEAMTLGDRIIVLNKGVIQQIDTPQNLYNHPANKFVAGFIGIPKINFLDGTISSRGGQLYFVTEDIKLELKDKTRFSTYENHQITLAVRPEHITSKPNSTKQTTYFHTKVDGIELLGHEGHIFFKLNNEKWTARLDSSALQKPPFSIDLYFDNQYLMIFDPETGLNLEEEKV